MLIWSKKKPEKVIWYGIVYADYFTDNSEGLNERSIKHADECAVQSWEFNKSTAIGSRPESTSAKDSFNKLGIQIFINQTIGMCDQIDLLIWLYIAEKLM